MVLRALVAANLSVFQPTLNSFGARVKTIHASGTFDVQIKPLPAYNTDDANLGRMSIDKQFHGDLEGISKGEMLSAGTGAGGSSGGYVAIESVKGTIAGRSGTFVFQHSATMNRGVPALSVSVIPDSGTGDLTGLTGTLMINIADGKHSYEFDYMLPAMS